VIVQTKLTKQILTNPNQPNQAKTKPDQTKTNEAEVNQTKPFSNKSNQKKLTKLNLNQPNQTIPNQIQASVCKDLRCPKVLHNSCTDPYLFLSSGRRTFQNQFILVASKMM